MDVGTNMRITLRPEGHSQSGIARLKLLIVLAVVVIAGFGGLLAYQKLTYKPPYRMAGDQFMKALASRDATTSYGLFSENLKKQYTEDSWKQAINSSFANYNGKPIFVKQESVSDPHG